MAVVADANSDRLYRNTGAMDYNSPYAVMAWVRLDSSANNFGYIFCITTDDTSIDNEDMVGNWGTTLQLRVNTRIAATSDNQLGTTLTADTWYHLAMVRESVTSLKLYVNGSLSATSTADCTSRTASGRMSYLEHNNNVNAMFGRMACIKEYSTSLTIDEVLQEMNSIRPVRLANLNAWYPIFTGERTKDYSGSNYTFTESGSLTDADGPPISWGTRALSFFVPSAGGTTYPQSATGTLTTVGTIIKRDNKYLIGTLTSAGAIAKQTTKTFTGTLSLAGNAIKSNTLSLAGTLITSGILTRKSILSFTGTLTSSGSFLATALKSLTGQLISSGALIKAVSHTSLTGTVSTAGTLLKQSVKSFVGILTTAGALSTVKTALVNLTGVISFSGSISKSTLRNINGTLSLSAALTKQTIKNLVGELTSSGIVSTSQAFLQSLTGVLTIGGSLAKLPQKKLSGILNGSGSISRLISKSFSGLLSFLGSLIGIIPNVKIDVTLTDSLVNTLTLSESVVYNVNLSDVSK